MLYVLLYTCQHCGFGVLGLTLAYLVLASPGQARATQRTLVHNARSAVHYLTEHIYKVLKRVPVYLLHLVRFVSRKPAISYTD